MSIKGGNKRALVHYLSINPRAGCAILAHHTANGLLQHPHFRAARYDSLGVEREVTMHMAGQYISSESYLVLKPTRWNSDGFKNF